MNDTVPKAAAPNMSLPYIDRRSLSEAWFSALHLASDGPALANARERRAPCEAPADLRRCVADARVSTGASNPAPLRRRTSAAPQSPLQSPGGGVAAARRSPSARVARASVELARPRSYAPFRTSLTIGPERRRVQLLLRRDGGTLHVVALCSSSVAGIVRRALACADAHLRGRGEAVRSSVHVIGSTGALA